MNFRFVTIATPADIFNYSFIDWILVHVVFMFYSLYEEGLLSIDSKYLKEEIKSGNLIKKGHKVKSMKERWFVLQPGKLSYYTTRTMKELKGCIALNSESKVENIPDSKSGKCRFSVVCGDTNVSYEMEASTQRDKNEWINLIQVTIGMHDISFYLSYKNIVVHIASTSYFGNKIFSHFNISSLIIGF